MSTGTNNTSALAIGGYGAPTAITQVTEEWSDPVYTNKTVTVS
jgi:hypothetical protein